MGEKVNISATIDEENKEFLDRAEVNASGLINQLLTQYRTHGGEERPLLEMRKRQLRSEIEELDARQETKEKELEIVLDRLGQQEEEVNQIIEEADENLDEHVREPDNPAVQNWAAKAGLEPEELLSEIEGGRE